MSTQAPSPGQAREAWDAIADRFDQHITPRSMAFGERALGRLRLGPGVRVLDVAAGTGALAIPAARSGAEVLAVDISPEMVRRLEARALAEELPTLHARVDDGQQLDVEDDAFDAVVSMNGISVLPDLHSGLREAVRVTRPGGQVLLIAFGPLPRAEFVAFTLGALRTAAPEAVPPPDAGPMPPFRLADPTVLQATLEEAGLVDVGVETADWEMPVESVDHLLEGVLSSNPIAGQLFGALTDEQFADARQVLDGMLRERSGGAPDAVLHTEMNIAVGTA